mgnify:CR=1 FL=1
MIIGIGNDLANIERIKKSIEKFGQRFINKIFSAEEQAELSKRQKISAHEYACSAARRFAAKEACSKALGTGFKQGIFWSDLIITHTPAGKPELQLRGAAAKRLAALSGNASCRLHVTMTDDYPWAQAFVIIEAL